jgi:polyhydroxybutyrate depolymerase
MNLPLVALFLLAACQVPAQPQAPAPELTRPGLHTRALVFQGRERRYLVYTPPAYDGSKALPLVLMFHGGGGQAREAMQSTGWTEKADRSGFFAVFPEGSSPDPSQPASFRKNPQTWNDGSGRFYAGRKGIDDVGFARAVLKDLEANLRVDPRRMFATGFSNGASMAYRVGMELSDRIAAIAPVASSGLRVPARSLSAPVSLLAIQGAKDPRNPLEGGDMKTLDGELDPRPPIRSSIQRWAALLGLPAQPSSTRDQNGVREERWTGDGDSKEVRFLVVDDLGHTWPGGTNALPRALVGPSTRKLNADDAIWTFFTEHPKPEAQPGAR